MLDGFTYVDQFGRLCYTEDDTLFTGFCVTMEHGVMRWVDGRLATHEQFMCALHDLPSFRRAALWALYQEMRQ